MKNKSRCLSRIVLLAGLLGSFAATTTPKPGPAQVQTGAEGKPCCSITSIDTKSGLVSAKVNATSQTFQFRPNNPSLLRSMKVGEGVYANFTTRIVSLDGANNCCTIVGVGPVPVFQPPIVKVPSPSQPGGSVLQPAPLTGGAQQEQCCSITGMDAKNGLVSAKVTVSGQGFLFRPHDPALLSALKEGESIYANFQAKLVSLDGKDVVGTIIAEGLPPSAVRPKRAALASPPGIQFRPGMIAGVGTPPCGAGNIPNLAGPIAPSSATPLDPLAAVNELQRITWTNFSAEIRCDVTGQLLAMEGQNLVAPGDREKELCCGVHQSFGASFTNMHSNVNIASAPGIRYACLTPQDCPAGVAPGFKMEVPLDGPPWSVGVGGSLNLDLEVYQEKPIGGGAWYYYIQCCDPIPIEFTLSNIKLSTVANFSTPTDLGRPELSTACVTVDATLNLGGVLSTDGPQHLTLTAATAPASGQLTFTNPVPFTANVNLPLPGGLSAQLRELTLNMTFDPVQGATLEFSGRFVIPDLRPWPVNVPFDQKQTLPIPSGLLQALSTGLPRPWGENPPSQFWTQPAAPSLDFASSAQQIESAIPPHIPWGAVLSIDHSAPILPPMVTPFGTIKPGQAIPRRFSFVCPPSTSYTPAGGKFMITGPPPLGANECYRLEYDSAIHTGEYLTAEVFRYAATHSQDALTRVKQLLDGNGNGNGIARLFWVTEDAAVSKEGRMVAVKDGPGLFSRTAFPSDSPLPLGDSPTGTVPGYHNCYFMRPEGGWNVGTRHFATLGDVPPALLAQLQFITHLPFGGVPQGKLLQPVGRIWYGLGCGEGDESPLSRDQYVGIFMGLAYAHALVPDPDVQKTTSDLITKALIFLIQNNWDVRVPPDRRIPMDSHFLRSWDAQLGFLRIGASVNPNAVMPNGVTLGQLYHIYAAGSKLTWVPIWFTMLEPLTGGGFAANLSHAVVGPTLFLETDPALRQNFMLWYNILRRSTQHHKNAYFNAVSMLVRAAAPSQIPSPSNPNLTLRDEFKGILAEWLRRRDEVNAGNGLPLTFVGDPSYQANLFNGSGVALYTSLTGDHRYLAKYALPIYARNGDGLDFAWQRDPFDIAVHPPPPPSAPGSSDGGNAPPSLTACLALLRQWQNNAGASLFGMPLPLSEFLARLHQAGCENLLGGAGGGNPPPPPDPCIAQLPAPHCADGAANATTPYQIFYCGSDHANQEAPGVDYLLPYWIGVYLGILPKP